MNHKIDTNRAQWKVDEPYDNQQLEGAQLTKTAVERQPGVQRRPAHVGNCTGDSTTSVQNGSECAVHLNGEINQPWSTRD